VKEGEGEGDRYVQTSRTKPAYKARVHSPRTKLENETRERNSRTKLENETRERKGAKIYTKWGRRCLVHSCAVRDVARRCARRKEKKKVQKKA
jgi:hypothetical protein